MRKRQTKTPTASTAAASSPSTIATADSGREPSDTPPATTLRGVRVACLMNARYHAAREAFLDNGHRWLMFGVIAAGAGAVVSMASQAWGVSWVNTALGAAAAVFGALDLTFDLSNRARTHALMKRRYYELLADAESGAKTVPEAEACLHRLSAEEEPAYHALLMSCWNAATESVYGDHVDQYEIPGYHRLFQNFCRFDGAQYDLRASASSAPAPAA